MGWFFKRRTIWFPTLTGGLIIIISIISISFYLFTRIYSFLSPTTKPVSKTLVIEGWIPESGLKNALAYYENNHYTKMILTGVPITQWTYSSPFSNMADASAGTMKQFFFKDTIYRAIIPATIQRDRTYSTAVAMKMQLDSWGIKADSFDLYSMGAHSRRSYLMFKKAFPNSKIGLLTDVDPSFDAEKWYNSSRGFRTVFSELISYYYSFLLFKPNEEETRLLIQIGTYIDKIQADRYQTDREFADSTKSPLSKADIQFFRGLRYFDIDTNWRIKARFVVDTSQAPFFMPTTTERLPRYRKYADIHFVKDGKPLRLTAYQNLDYLQKKPAYKGLFVPYKDLTNSEESYGGGRYIDIEIPESDEVIIDFNMAYNPYCAYHERWSCPLPPAENYLEIAVTAGVKKYKSTH